ncbi:MAG: hypothetical protein HUJ63_10185 [Enterococcus sp.]|nr:hypothetical protein [Enterococcus sp.]
MKLHRTQFDNIQKSNLSRSELLFVNNTIPDDQYVLLKAETDKYISFPCLVEELICPDSLFNVNNTEHLNRLTQRMMDDSINWFGMTVVTSDSIKFDYDNRSRFYIEKDTVSKYAIKMLTLITDLFNKDHADPLEGIRILIKHLGQDFPVFSNTFLDFAVNHVERKDRALILADILLSAMTDDIDSKSIPQLAKAINDSNTYGAVRA